MIPPNICSITKFAQTHTTSKAYARQYFRGINGYFFTRAQNGLIIVGDQDVATPPAKAERVHERIQGSRLVTIPGSGHTSTVEEPAAVNAAIKELLNAL